MSPHSSYSKRTFLHAAVTSGFALVVGLVLYSVVAALQLPIWLTIGAAVLILPASLALALLVTRRDRRRLTEPIEALIRTATIAADTHDFGVQVEKVEDEALGLLSDYFNELLLQLQRREFALQRTEEHSRLLLETLPHGIRENDLNGRITYANAALHGIFGLRPAELLGRRVWDDVVDQSEAAAQRQLLREIREDKATPEPFRLRCCNAGDEVRNLEIVWAYQRDRAGAPSGQVAIVTDITEQVRAEAEREKLEGQLRQSQRLEAVGRLAGGLAHDFNNLLTTILGYSELLTEGLDQENPALIDVSEIHTAANRAARLTQQLLAFGRGQVMVPRLLDINQIARDLHAPLRRVVGEDIELVTIEESRLWRVMADAGQLEIVFLNLAINAREAMPEGGKLTIETTNVQRDQTITAEHPEVSGEFVMLTISDTGRGISPADRPRIFEPFFTTKPVGTGTGLGLSTVYGIVKQSQGYVTVYSEQGEGTTVSVLLPRAEREVILPRPPPEPAPGRVETTILVVEDELAVRTLTERMLTCDGYRVISAPDGHAGLELAKIEAAVHMLIADVSLPGLSGPALAELAREKHAKMAVLFVSGYGVGKIPETLLHSPRTSFLCKPYTAAQLRNAVKALLDGTSDVDGAREERAV